MDRTAGVRSYEPERFGWPAYEIGDKLGVRLPLDGYNLIYRGYVTMEPDVGMILELAEDVIGPGGGSLYPRGCRLPNLLGNDRFEAKVIERAKDLPDVSSSSGNLKFVRYDR